MTLQDEPLTTADIDAVTEALIAQLVSVMGVKQPNWIYRCLRPLFHLPARRMSTFLIELDGNIAKIGWNAAIKQFLGKFVTEVDIQGVEKIPLHGALMVAGNHPAAFDIVILAAAIKREDIKIIISDIPIIQLLPNIATHCIPVPYHLPARYQTVRDALAHLENSGALFIFPRGNVEPDPAVTPGAEESLAGWSDSVELFLRRVSQTQTVIAISSGMLSANWFKNPLIRLWKKYEQRQKVAEIFQITSQVITNKKPASLPRVNFSAPMSVADLGGVDATAGKYLTGITDQARRMLRDLPHP